MKLKLKNKKGEWYAGIYRGNGGVSSLVIHRQSKNLWGVIGIFFNLKYIWRGLTW